MKIKSMKQNALLFFVNILAVFLIFSACKKQYDSTFENTSQLTQSARAWLLNEIKNGSLEDVSITSISARTTLNQKKNWMKQLNDMLEWRNSQEYNKNGIKYVVTPVQQKNKSFSNEDFDGVRYFIFYNDADGKMCMNIIEILSKQKVALKGSLRDIASEAFLNKYLSKETNIENLDANILFYDKNYNPQESFEITHGKWSRNKISLERIKSFDKGDALSTISQRVTEGTGGCETIYTILYEYDTYTGKVLRWWIIDVQEYCPNNNPTPPYGGGGGGGGGTKPPTTDDCTKQFLSTPKKLSEGVQVVSELINSNVKDINTFTKEKNPEWRCLKSLTWALFSHEKGIVELVDKATNKWQWKSLSHNTITKTGMPYGGTVSSSNGIGTASFTPGTKNVLYAGMSVKFDVTYAPICDCPGVNAILPPYTISYNANALFDAKP